MAETFRRGKLETYLDRLRVREAALRAQLAQTEFAGTEPFLQGELSAIDVVIRELKTEFDLDTPLAENLPIEANEIEWLHFAARSPSFDFLSDPKEDIYTPSDGKRINAKK